MLRPATIIDQARQAVPALGHDFLGEAQQARVDVAVDLSLFQPRLGLSQVARVRDFLLDERVVRHSGEVYETKGAVQFRVREAVRLTQEREQWLAPRPVPRLRFLVNGDAVLEQLVVDEASAADRRTRNSTCPAVGWSRYL